MTIEKVALVTIPSKNQDEAKDWWISKLGFKIIEDTEVPQSTQRWIQLEPPQGGVHIALWTNDAQEDRVGTTSSVSFACSDVHKAYEEFQAKGIVCPKSPQSLDWGDMLLFSDGEGNTHCLIHTK